MKNFIRDGEVQILIAQSEVKPGDIVINGSLLGVAIVGGDKGDEISVATKGVYEFSKAPELTINLGDKAYLNPDDYLLTNAEKHGEADNHLVGVFVRESKPGEKLCEVRIGS